MSDRVKSVVRFLQWASFVIGLAIAALGGGGSAVQYQLSPESFSSSTQVADTVTFYTLAGIITSIVGPGVGALTTFLWGKFFSGRSKAIAQYSYAITSQAVLVKYLESRPADLAAAQGLAKGIDAVFAEAVRQSTDEKPAVIVEAK